MPKTIELDLRMELGAMVLLILEVRDPTHFSLACVVSHPYSPAEREAVRMKRAFIQYS